jgi:hypothetical protein
MILDQADRDVAVSDLLTKVSDVYALMKEDDTLAGIPSMQALYGKVARQTLEYADFIVHYSRTKSICESIPLRQYRCGMQKLARHWVLHSKGILMLLALLHAISTILGDPPFNWVHDSDSLTYTTTDASRYGKNLNVSTSVRK